MSGVDPKLIESTSLSDVGQVRTSNQDYCDEFLSPGGNRLLVVADGMGGHRGGATASRVATETIGEIFSSATEEPSETLYTALAEANRRVHQQSIDDPELRGMGTTVVSILFDTDGNVWVAHVGDSRAYRLHAAGMEQITQDHSVVGEMGTDRSESVMLLLQTGPETRPDCSFFGYRAPVALPGRMIRLRRDGEERRPSSEGLRARRLDNLCPLVSVLRELRRVVVPGGLTAAGMLDIGSTVHYPPCPALGVGHASTKPK